jgi:hypothetical protein
MVKKNYWIMGISIFIGMISVGTTFPSVIAASISSYQPSDDTQVYVNCPSCSSGCCTNCSEAVDFVTEYAWAHAPPFPKINWFHSYPITKFASDLTIWTANFAVELQNGFEETCYQPVFIIAEVVIAATQYALKEVIKMLHEILFIFYPAILAIAFMRAVVSYLKQVCDGTNPPDQSSIQLHTNFSLSSYTQYAFQKIGQFITAYSLIFHKILLFER